MQVAGPQVDGVAGSKHDSLQEEGDDHAGVARVLGSEGGDEPALGVGRLLAGLEDDGQVELAPVQRGDGRRETLSIESRREMIRADPSQQCRRGPRVAESAEGIERMSAQSSSGFGRGSSTALGRRSRNPRCLLHRESRFRLGRRRVGLQRQGRPTARSFSACTGAGRSGTRVARRPRGGRDRRDACRATIPPTGGRRTAARGGPGWPSDRPTHSGERPRRCDARTGSSSLCDKTHAIACASCNGPSPAQCGRRPLTCTRGGGRGARPRRPRTWNRCPSGPSERTESFVR